MLQAEGDSSWIAGGRQVGGRWIADGVRAEVMPMDCRVERTELPGADGRIAGGERRTEKDERKAPPVSKKRGARFERTFFFRLTEHFSTAFSVRLDPVCDPGTLRLLSHRHIELLRPRQLGRRAAGHRSAATGTMRRLLPTRRLLRAGRNPRAGWCGLAGGDRWGAGGSAPEVGPVGTPVGGSLASSLCCFCSSEQPERPSRNNLQDDIGGIRIADFDRPQLSYRSR